MPGSAGVSGPVGSRRGEAGLNGTLFFVFSTAIIRYGLFFFFSIKKANCYWGCWVNPG